MEYQTLFEVTGNILKFRILSKQDDRGLISKKNTYAI